MPALSMLLVPDTFAHLTPLLIAVVTGHWGYGRVLARFTRQYDGDIITISTEGASFAATAEHPVWVVAGEKLDDRPPVEHVDHQSILGQLTSPAESVKGGFQ